MSFSLRHFAAPQEHFVPAGSKFFRRVLVPGVGAFFLEPFDDVAQRREILELLAAGVAVKNDDRHAPEALARDAPVRALLDHFVNAVFAPGGNPFHVREFRRALPGARISVAVPCAELASILMNHCSVARKITGLWQRQQCG